MPDQRGSVMFLTLIFISFALFMTICGYFVYKLSVDSSIISFYTANNPNSLLKTNGNLENLEVEIPTKDCPLVNVGYKKLNVCKSIPYSKCVNNACTEVQGEGYSNCYDDLDCI